MSLQRLMRIIGSLGLLAMCALIAHEGFRSILGLLGRAGWVLLWLVPLHALPLMLDIIGWQVLLRVSDPQRRTGLWTLFGFGAIREAVNRLLPVANVGGEIVGIRLLMFRGVSGAAAAASVIVETALTLLSQFAFVALGLLSLLHVTTAQHYASSVRWTLLGALPVIVAFIVLLRYGSVFQRCGRFIENMLSHDSHWRPLLAQSGDVDREIRRLYGARAQLLSAALWQLSSFLLATLETWLTLRWFGSPVSLANALALECVTQAVRNFVFVVPLGMGVQEAGLIALGALLGVSGASAVALSLAKRLREIIFGLPALLAWQLIEAHRAREPSRPPMGVAGPGG